METTSLTTAQGGRATDDVLLVERYKYVTDRKKYFTDLARSAFDSYSKLLAALGAGAITLVSTKNKLELRPDVVVYLIWRIWNLLSFFGIVAAAQIAFCLKRWRGYQREQELLDPTMPRLQWWWWVFETLYIVAILVSIASMWYIARHLAPVLQQKPAA